MTSNPSTTRAMSHDDVGAAHRLSQAVGWGHRYEDWEFLLALGKGVVSTAVDGELSGVAMWWPYGTDYAAIGMVIVSPSHQRMGIGKFLMDAILREAEGRRALLNATQEGIRLYESLGFRPTGTILTHYGQFAGDRHAFSESLEVRRFKPDDWGEIVRLDREASAMDRLPLLSALRDMPTGLVAEVGGRLTGFILPRPFQKGTLLGPIIADSEQTSMALIAAAAERGEGQLRVDIPGDAPTLREWLTRVGLSNVGQVTTMWLPAPPDYHSNLRVYGLAAQATG